MSDEEKWLKLIQKANEEQTQKLAKVVENQTKLLKEEIKNTVNEIENKVDTAIQNINELNKKHILTERKLRRNNIVIFGLNIKKQNLLHETIASLNTLLDVTLQDRDINHVYMTGKSEKPPIIIELISFLKKQHIFSKVKNLKGTGVSITNDLCYEDREDRKILRDHQKRATAQNLNSKIKGNKLTIENKDYTVEDLKALEREEISDAEQIESEDSEKGKQEETQDVNKKSMKTMEEAASNRNQYSNKRDRRKIIYSPTAQTSGGNANARSTRSKNPTKQTEL